MRGDPAVAISAVVAVAILFLPVVATYFGRSSNESPLALRDVPLSLRLGLSVAWGATILGFFTAVVFLRPYRESIGVPGMTLYSAVIGAAFGLAALGLWRSRVRRRGLEPGAVTRAILRRRSRYEVYEELEKTARDRDSGAR